MQIGIEILIIVLLVLVNGVLAASEMAVVSARRARLQQQAEAGDAGAREALALAREPNRFLSTVQIGITTIGILAGAFGGATLAQAMASSFQDAGVSDRFGEAIAVGAIVVCITYFTLIIGELVPKRLALQYADRVASRIARPMRFVSAAMAPAVWFLGRSTDAVLAILRIPPQVEAPVTEEEIRTIIKESTEAGVFEPAEHQLIRSALRLGDRHVAELMVPRRDIAWIDAVDSAETVCQKVKETSHSRFPVCRGDLDSVAGVVSIRDLWLQSCEGGAIDVPAALRQPLFVPESLSVLQALERFREERATLAVVVDEYGGTAGVVSLADILEEIVGDLPAIGDAGGPSVVQRGDGSWLIDGSVPIDKVVELLGMEPIPPQDNYHTLAGFVLFVLGRVPAVAESVRWGGYRFEVVDMDGVRIDKVLVTRLTQT